MKPPANAAVVARICQTVTRSPTSRAPSRRPLAQPDILINAAGINTRQHADDVTPEGWDVTLNLNLSAPFFLAQALVPAHEGEGLGADRQFRLPAIARAFPAGISYGASKAGVEQLTRAMAEAWSPHGITANAVAPGFFPHRTDWAGLCRPGAGAGATRIRPVSGATANLATSMAR